MVFKTFAFGVIWRVIAISALMFIALWFVLLENSIIVFIALLVLTIILIANLIKFTLGTNQKISRFLESIRYSDFTTGFTGDNELGSSFRELNDAFTEVMNVFRKTRAEKEEHSLFLYVVIQHINAGIISFDSHGRIGIVNNAAKHLLKITQFKNIQDIKKLSPDLLSRIQEMKPGNRDSIKINEKLHLIIQSTEIKMGGENWTLLSLQNINAELQQNELEAWQNLTKVLRHEIMNSMAPIAILVGSMRDILDGEVRIVDNDVLEIEKEGYSDLKEGLVTIENRSNGLIKFINAYRDYTNIPTPEIRPTSVKVMLDSIFRLLREELQMANISLVIKVHPTDLIINLDQELIQMILINLIKNAKEALESHTRKEIIITANRESENRKYISVTDFGPGIKNESLARIFVPFYSTKKHGSGIGLSISRQIMNLHKGSLIVNSTLGQETTFTLNFE